MLKDLVSKIEYLNNIIKMDINDINPKTRPGWQVQIANAKDELKTKREELKTAVLQNSFGILLTGNVSACNELANLVKSKDTAFVIDVSDLYHKISKSIEETVGHTRHIGITQISKLSNILKDVCERLDVEFKAPTTNDLPVVPTYTNTFNWVKTTTLRTIGAQLNQVYITQKLVSEILHIRYTDDVIPVMLINAEMNEVNNLFYKGVAIISINGDSEIHEKFMNDAFKDVQKQLRKK